MTIATVALILLIIRIIGLAFIAMVISVQYRLFKYAIDTGLVRFRMVMFLLGVVLLLSCVMPLYVDYYYAFVNTDIGWEHNGLVVLYAVNNATSFLVSSYLLWKIYRIAGGDRG